MNPLLYGHNTDERIVAVQANDDRTMRVYLRDGQTVSHEHAEFFPFFFLADKNLIQGFSKRHWVKQLDGSAYYQYLCVFEEWPALWDAIRYVLDKYNRFAEQKKESYGDLDELYFHSDAVTQYLMQTGRTLFKGMTFEELHRLQLDIETYTGGASRFSNASRSTDRIILVALSDSAGWTHVVDGKKLSEKAMLEELVRIINEKDPDVIEGHNIYNFDLPYILKRCELHQVKFGIGRDGSVPRSFETRASYAERAYEYTAAEIAGRHIIDTMLLVQSYDVTKRNMESYGLKYAAKYFGFASENRTYIKGDQISWYWDNDPKTLMKYALDDVIETRKLSEQLSGTAFYLAQMLPHGYGQVARMGSAAKIESLMVREYLRVKHSIPKPSVGVQTTGGYTDIFVTGVVGPVLHADVESLYPSVMIAKEVAPASDAARIFRQLLKTLTASRLDTKRRMETTAGAQEKAKLDAMQSSLKILINSFYGYLGYTRGLFNDFAQADVVTTTGQELLKQMIEFIRSENGNVIEVDTDGIFFVPPTNVKGEDAERKFVEALSQSMPEGIFVALDGRYIKMLSYKMKNYALLDYEGRMKVKGSSLISRAMERFGRSFVHQCIDCLLRDDIDGLHRIYMSLRNDILEHKLDVRSFAKTEALKDSLAEYKRHVEMGRRNKSAGYEIALAAGRSFKPGDYVSFYITGNDANVKTFEKCKPVAEWDPNFPDENVAYYLRRLDEFSEKFKDFFEGPDYRSIFSPDDLFPFSSKGVAVVTRMLAQHKRVDDDSIAEQAFEMDVQSPDEPE